MQSQFVQTNNLKLHVMTDSPENGTSVVFGELVSFDRATHWVQHGAADEVNQRLLAFLR
jgi:pimeloyl-ACP methyl ester carboxylesterase